jgi:hypothetical protein
MPDGRWLVTGVTWADDTPLLRVVDRTDNCTELLPLVDVHLGWRADGTDGRRWCVGYFEFMDADTTAYHPCPSRAPVASGRQCDRCAWTEGFRGVHHSRSAEHLPPGLRRYLDQPHWLYVATFPDGHSKVGTASRMRKQVRLAEQGAAVASYLAVTPDGMSIRHVEEHVSRSSAIPQAIRPAAKLLAVVTPSPESVLRTRHADATDHVADAVTEFMRTGPPLPVEPVAEPHWRAPGVSARLLTTSTRHRTAYPGSLEAGTHGFTVRSMLGTLALVDVLDSGDAELAATDDMEFVADLGALVGTLVNFGDYRSRPQSVQGGLF